MSALLQIQTTDDDGQWVVVHVVPADRHAFSTVRDVAAANERPARMVAAGMVPWQHCHWCDRDDRPRGLTETSCVTSAGTVWTGTGRAVRAIHRCSVPSVVRRWRFTIIDRSSRGQRSAGIGRPIGTLSVG